MIELCIFQWVLLASRGKALTAKLDLCRTAGWQVQVTAVVCRCGSSAVSPVVLQTHPGCSNGAQFKSELFNFRQKSWKIALQIICACGERESDCAVSSGHYLEICNETCISSSCDLSPLLCCSQFRCSLQSSPRCVVALQMLRWLRGAAVFPRCCPSASSRI